MRFLVFLFTLYSLSGFSAEIVVKMLNKGSDGQKMVFEPSVIKVSIGDSVKFIPSSKGHSVQSFKGGDSRPAGAKKFKSRLNKPYTYKVEHEGIHVIQCKPHYAVGMIGMIVAGRPINLKTIEKLKVRGKREKNALRR